MSTVTKEMLIFSAFWIPLMVVLGRFGFYPLYSAIGTVNEFALIVSTMVSTVTIALFGFLGAADGIIEGQGK